MQLAVAQEAFAVRLAALEEPVVEPEVWLAAPEPGVSAAAAVEEPVVFVAGQALLVVEGQPVAERALLVVEGQLAAVE